MQRFNNCSVCVWQCGQSYRCMQRCWGDQGSPIQPALPACWACSFVLLNYFVWLSCCFCPTGWSSMQNHPVSPTGHAGRTTSSRSDCSGSVGNMDNVIDQCWTCMSTPASKAKWVKNHCYGHSVTVHNFVMCITAYTIADFTDSTFIER